MTFENNIISAMSTATVAMERIELLGTGEPLYVVGDNLLLIGSISDGDIRRGLISGLSLKNHIENFCNRNCQKLFISDLDVNLIKTLREKGYKSVPIVDNNLKLIRILSFHELKTLLPLDVVLMAGGKGTRLKPLTDNIPKPLIPLGNKVIIDYFFDHLLTYGIDNFYVSVNYLADKIKEHFTNKKLPISIGFIQEDEPLGTAGSISLIKGFRSDTVLIANSDILTNIDIEDLYIYFKNSNADIVVVTSSYKVSVPYGVLNSKNNIILGLEEKPTYTFQCNTGIYMCNIRVLNLIPHNQVFLMTELLEKAIRSNMVVLNYVFNGYWLDVGKHPDLEKAKSDIQSGMIK